MILRGLQFQNLCFVLEALDVFKIDWDEILRQLYMALFAHHLDWRFIVSLISYIHLCYTRFCFLDQILHDWSFAAFEGIAQGIYPHTLHGNNDFVNIELRGIVSLSRF